VLSSCAVKGRARAPAAAPAFPLNPLLLAARSDVEPSESGRSPSEAVFLDGHDHPAHREGPTRALLDNLDAELRRERATDEPPSARAAKNLRSPCRSRCPSFDV
jgi:hypothetical protein